MTKEELERLEKEKELQRKMQEAAINQQLALKAKQEQDESIVKNTVEDVKENQETVNKIIGEDNNMTVSQKDNAAIAASSEKELTASAIRNIKGETGNSLKDQFLDALTYFGPQIVAGVYGQATEGDLGLVAGVNAAGKLRDSYLDFQFKKEQVQNRQQQAGVSEYQKQSLQMRKAELEQRKLEEERRGVTSKASLDIRKEGLSQSQNRMLESSAKNFIAKGTPAEREVSQLAEINRVKDLIESNAPFRGLLESAMAKGLGGEVGNLAVEERKSAAQIVGFQGDLANLQEYVTSNISSLRKEQIQKLLNFMEPKLRKRLEERASRYVKSRSKMFDIDPDYYKNYLLETTGIGFSESQEAQEAKPKVDINRQLKIINEIKAKRNK